MRACWGDGGPRFAAHRVTEDDGPSDLTALGWWPDLDDPATAGVLVGMLREAVAGRTVEILMFRGSVEVCVGPASQGGNVFVDTSLGRAAARAWLSTKEQA